MAISFPNESRSYDSARRAVRFWGYDSAIEASFFVTENALKQLQPDIQPDEASFLRAFDKNKELIHRAASRLYRRGQSGAYQVSARDL